MSGPFAATALLLPISVGATLLTAALIVYASYGWKRAEQARARGAAAALGLDFELRSASGSPALERLPSFARRLVDAFSPWRICGRYRGVQVSVCAETRSYGKSSKTFLVAAAEYERPLPFDLKAGRETVFAKIGKALFNLPDVEIGDWAFDEAVRIKASDAEAAAVLFSRAELRDSFVALLSAFPGASAENDAVRWETAAVRSSFGKLAPALDALVSFAAALDASRR